MKYSVSELSNQYIQHFQKSKFDTKKVLMPYFDLETYYDIGYLTAITDITNDFIYVDDLSVTEEFLKGD